VEACEASVWRLGAVAGSVYLESTGRVAWGRSSSDGLEVLGVKSQRSRTVALEKSMSRAPAFVPVAIFGWATSGDQAKAALLGMSRKRTMVSRREVFAFKKRKRRGRRRGRRCQRPRCRRRWGGAAQQRRRHVAPSLYDVRSDRRARLGRCRVECVFQPWTHQEVFRSMCC
jgi:hypothetical protein